MLIIIKKWIRSLNQIIGIDNKLFLTLLSFYTKCSFNKWSIGKALLYKNNKPQFKQAGVWEEDPLISLLPNKKL